MLALRLRQQGLSRHEKSGDHSQIVTEADLGISALLRNELGTRLIEEETADRLTVVEARELLRSSKWTFIADPIDGTKPFSVGLESWGVMLAACRSGWPEISVVALPEWGNDRSAPLGNREAGLEHGIVLVGCAGKASWARLRGGRMVGDLQPLGRPGGGTGHIGWGAVTSSDYKLDHAQGLFSWCESSHAAQIALLATGRLDAATIDQKLWDVAPGIPILSALGFSLFRWPDLAPPPAEFIDIFEANFSARGSLWLMCQGREMAGSLGRAISR